MKNSKKANEKKGTKKAVVKGQKDREIVKSIEVLQKDLPVWNATFLDLRINYGLSQTEFGKKTQIGSKHYISDIENGRRGVTFAQIAKVEKAFGIELYDR